MRPVLKGFYVGSYVAGMLGVPLAVAGCCFLGDGLAGGLLLGVGGGMVLHGVCALLALVYRMWQSLADGDPRTSPGKALILLFVPVFNVYWLFQALRGFAVDFNRYAAERGRGHISVSVGLSTALCVSVVVAPALPIAFVLLGVFIADVSDAINAFCRRGSPGLRRFERGAPIEAERLTKRYGDFAAVSELSFAVGRGEVVGFLGANAAGKTTTMRMLAGFLPSTSGTARICGHDILEDSVAARGCIGYMPENLALYPDMRVIEYLRYRAGVKGVHARARPAAVAESMRRCGVGEVARQVIGRLSRGYRQRVGLADAMMGDPPVLILDEPTVGLDPNEMRRIRRQISEMGEDHTVLLSTHILPEVEAVCGRVLIVHRGRLVFSGLPDGRTSAEERPALSLEVRGPQEKVRATLEGLNGVGEVHPEGDGRFAVVQRAGADVREEIFRAMSRESWPVLEMTTRRPSLEEVFVRLTAGEEA